jgi:phosphatidylserine/phosphatidylglycerophosphate/cardiolipin synthase-like enzyme
MQQHDLSLSLHSFNLYFQSHRAEIDGKATAHLVRFIEGAQKSIDCAIYDLKHPDVLKSLKRVSEKKKLRIAYDGGTKVVTGDTKNDPKPPGTEEALRQFGLLDFATPVHEPGGHLMHSKYIVRDGVSVWTGSGNWTHGGLELQDNNFLAIDSPELAASYEKNFEHIVKGSRTPGKPAKTPIPAIKVSEVDIQPFFSGHGTELIEDRIASLIKKAKKIRIIAMLISDPGILDALAKFRPSEMDVLGILDPHEMAQVMKPARGKAKDPSLFWFSEGDKRFVAAPSHAFSQTDNNDFMHNKVMIFDDQTVVAGSYNFSENAESNDENVVVLNAAPVAKAYTKYFEALWTQYRKHGAPLPPVSIAEPAVAHEEELAPV